MADNVPVRDPRTRILAAGVLTTGVSRGVSALVPLLVIPIALRELGVAGYGAWAAAVTTTTLLAFADFGVGTGLMTRLGGLVDAGRLVDPQSGRRLVTAGYAVVIAVAGVLLVCLLLATRFGDLSVLLGADPSVSAEVELIIAVTVGAFFVNMVCSLVVRVQYAVGRQARANLWQTSASLAMLASVWGVTGPGGGGASGFIAAAAITPVLVAGLNSLLFFAADDVGRQLVPRVSMLSRQAAASLLRLGVKFLLVSALMTLTVAIDPFVVAHTAALSEVAAYAIPYRIFALIGTVSVMLALPLWPMHARAVSTGDVVWIRKVTMRIALLSGGVVGVGSAVVAVFGPRLIQTWLSGTVDYSLVLWSGLGAWWLVQAAMGPLFMVQNGAEIVRPQIIGYSLLLLTAVPAKWFVSSAFGFQWMPWVGTLLFCLFVLPAAVVGYRQALDLAGTKTGVAA